MIVDSSALLAIAFNEPEELDFLNLIASATCFMSAANFLEVCIVYNQRVGGGDEGEIDALVSSFGIELVPVAVSQISIARDAFRRFGRGNHPARLNFGDCFAYALAKETGRPLLFKGTDFGQTDIACAPVA